MTDDEGYSQPTGQKSTDKEFESSIWPLPQHLNETEDLATGQKINAVFENWCDLLLFCVKRYIGKFALCCDVCVFICYCHGHGCWPCGSLVALRCLSLISLLLNVARLMFSFIQYTAIFTIYSIWDFVAPATGSKRLLILKKNYWYIFRNIWFYALKFINFEFTIY